MDEWDQTVVSILCFVEVGAGATGDFEEKGREEGAG